MRRMHADVFRAEHRRASFGLLEIAKHLARGEVVQRAREVAVAAERHYERHAVADRFAAGGDDREPARKADPDNADFPVGAEMRLFARPLDRVFDDIGDLWRDLELLQIGSGDRDHTIAGWREG